MGVGEHTALWSPRLVTKGLSPFPRPRTEGAGHRLLRLHSHSPTPVVLASGHPRGAAAAPGLSEGPERPYLLSASSSGYLSTTLMMSSTTSPTHRICFSPMRPLTQLSARRGAGVRPGLGVLSRRIGSPLPEAARAPPPRPGLRLQGASRSRGRAASGKERRGALAPHAHRPERSWERRLRGPGPRPRFSGLRGPADGNTPTSRPPFLHWSDGLGAVANLPKARPGKPVNRCPGPALSCTSRGRSAR